MSLETELATYHRELQNLLDKSGKYALVHGDTVVGILDTYGDAVQEGYRLFGLDKPFLVKQIRAVEVAYYITRGVPVVCPS